MFYLLSLSLIILPPPSSPSSSSSLPFARRRFHRGRKGRETHKVKVSGRANPRRRERERLQEKRGYSKRGEEEGPAFQSPVSTRDPRPLNHPPQLGRNSVLFSPLLSLLVPPFFLPRARAFLPFFLSSFIFFFFIYLPTLFRPFLPDHGDNRAILRPLGLLSRLLFSFIVRQCSIVLTGERERTVGKT